MHSQVDFGYAPIYVYGHLIITVIAAPLLYLAFKRGWPKLLMGALAAIALWSLASFVIVNYVVGINSRTTLPTEQFFKAGEGVVLDMGAGSGRSALMVLESRPKATLVALDTFAESYTEHFHEDSAAGQARILANLSAAGVAGRATIKQGDMRQIPYPDATFDAIVSVAAIDHLGSKGAGVAFKEASRVIKPGGDFLLIVLSKDAWLKFIAGPLMLHSGTPKMESWAMALNTLKFDIVEKGTRPATIWILARKQNQPSGI